MQKFLIGLLFIAANTIQAQTTDFSIDVVAPDSMFLVQNKTETPTPQTPRPAVIVTHSLFKSWKELADFIGKIRQEAVAENEKAKTALDTAKKLEDAASKIEAAANKAKQ